MYNLLYLSNESASARRTTEHCLNHFQLYDKTSPPPREYCGTLSIALYFISIWTAISPLNTIQLIITLWFL